MSSQSNHPYFQWNTSSWYGSQLGMTGWILATAIFCYSRDTILSFNIFLLFIAPNLIGIFLWRARHRISIYSALQLLLVIAGIFSLLTVHMVDQAGLWEEIQVGSSISARTTYFLIIGLVILLMLLFYLRKRFPHKIF